MKTLPEMTDQELRAELDAAIEAERVADYVDGLTAWKMAKGAAAMRRERAHAEFARRANAVAGANS